MSKLVVTSERRDAADYIVVGGGSAGMAVATRLSADPHVRVLLLEAGRRDSWWNVLIHMPAALGLVTRFGSAVRYFPLEPQAELDGRRLAWPRGEVLGGSSSVNAMVYVRGHPQDFDAWAEVSGYPAWRAEHVLPAFRRMERYAGERGTERGGDGPVWVSQGQTANPLDQAFLAAGQQAGFPLAADFNGAGNEGFGALDRTIWAGRRESSATAYRRLGAGRGNLRIETEARAVELLLENDRCVGVLVQRGGQVERLHAAAEVIVACGAIGSPQLLMWSGIGHADELRAVGITPRHHLPGVGRNLQDHLEIQVQHRCLEPISLYGAVRGFGRVMTGARWLTTRTGPGATNHFETAALIRSQPDVPYPDLMLHFIKLGTSSDGQTSRRFHAYQIIAGPLRPASRGYLALRSPRRDEDPIIDPNYLSEARDRAEMRRCLELTREIMAQPAFDRFRGSETAPGADVRTPQEIDAYVRRTATFGHHPCGTCKMGSDELGVVDGELRVHGIAGLRVADASIMPLITSGNTNAPAIMIGERAAEFILRGSRSRALTEPTPASASPAFARYAAAAAPSATRAARSAEAACHRTSGASLTP